MTTAKVEELENKPINKILWQYALPAIVGVTVNMLYNLIDAVFIGQWVGKDAIIALGVVFPLMNLTAAFGLLVGIGSSSFVSIKLGMKDREEAEKIVGTSFLLNIISSGTVVVLLYIFLKPILMAAGANELTYPYARDFMQIYLAGNITLSLFYTFNSVMRSSGYPTKAMQTMMISIVANILLAPLFIYVLHMGIRGAAIATVSSMFIGLCIEMYHFVGQGSYLKLRLKYIRLRKDLILKIVSIGLSPFFIQIAGSALVFYINYQLNRYGDSSSDAIGAYVIVNRLLLLISTIVIGLAQGTQPLIGYNYGANRLDRVKDTLIYSIKVGMCITSIGFLMGMLAPHIFVAAFTKDPHITTLAARAFRFTVLAFPIVGMQIVVTNFFQSIGMAKKAIFLSLSRQFLFLAPALYFLPLLVGLDGVWLSMPIADFLSTIVAFFMCWYQLRCFKKIG